MVGAFGGKPPLVRLHSECLTGDVFGSLKCDCGPQLKEALRIIGEAGGGLLLYLRQEGRGIGLANKLRAYSLQDRGLDTVDANRRLGFADDERDYGHAAACCARLDRRGSAADQQSEQGRGAGGGGHPVVERVPHHMPANPHNADYLSTKRKKSGHLIEAEQAPTSSKCGRYARRQSRETCRHDHQGNASRRQSRSRSRPTQARR